jgi:hypothetical protein
MGDAADDLEFDEYRRRNPLNWHDERKGEMAKKIATATKKAAKHAAPATKASRSMTAGKAPAGVPPGGRPTPASGSHVKKDGKSTPEKDEMALWRKEAPLEEVPDLVEAGFDTVCERYRQVCTEVAALEAEKKELASLISPLLEAFEIKSVVGPDWVAVRSRGMSVKLDQTKLLAKGVKMEIIEACKVKTPYYYVQVVAKGESAD